MTVRGMAGPDQPPKEVRLRKALLLAQTGNRVVRPRDFEHAYSNVWAEFRRLERTGVLARVAHGYYTVVPEERRGRFWQPTIEGGALGIATADYGAEAVALMGPSAARLLGAIPRALSTATVAVPRQRPALSTTIGSVHFVKRVVSRLDVQRVDTEITTGWVTTPEQTALDLADRPTLGAVSPDTVTAAIVTLGGRVDHESVAKLAVQQHKLAAWQRYSWVLGTPIESTRRGVPSRGLHGIGNPTKYGISITER